MSWLGKMIGGTIGFAFGGPIGAVAGAAFGHQFVDKREDAYLSSKIRTQNRLTANEEAQLIFFTAVFSMLAKISKADGKISEEEISTIKVFMEQDLNLDMNGQNTAINIFRQAIHSNESFEAFAFQFYSIFKSQRNLIDLMMDVLFRVSVADGDISENEREMLLEAARIFNYSQVEFEKFESRYIQHNDEYYAVLKCDKNSSNAEIKKQYRTLATEYHPDKIESKGLPEEFIKFANDKFKEIQTAYDKIKQERGI